MTNNHKELRPMTYKGEISGEIRTENGNLIKAIVSENEEFILLEDVLSLLQRREEAIVAKIERMRMIKGERGYVE